MRNEWSPLSLSSRTRPVGVSEAKSVGEERAGTPGFFTFILSTLVLQNLLCNLYLYDLVS